MGKNHQRLGKLPLVSTLICALVASAIASSTRPFKEKLTAEEVVAKHLESIGTAEARSAVKSQLILGTTTSTLRLGGSGKIDGNVVLASAGTRNLIGVVYTNLDYPHDKMAFDGKDVTIAELTPGEYSRLGRFFRSNDMPIKEGLLTGTLSSAWPLLDMSTRTAKLKYSGTKKIDGRETYVLKYQPKNDGGLQTSLYFDAETFRHVRTEYDRRQSQLMAGEPGITQQQGDALVKLTEDFSDFKTEHGITLPHGYRLQLSLEALKVRYLQDWVFTLTTYVFNRPMADDEFKVSGTISKKK